MIIVACILVSGREYIPSFYTHNYDTVHLTSKIILILSIFGCGCVALQTLGGIYRGLALQKIAAIFVFGSYWIIALPISIVLLFKYSYKDNLDKGVETIWGSLAFGNVLATITAGLYLLCFTNWKKAVKTVRVQN
eukprot:UN13152